VFVQVICAFACTTATFLKLDDTREHRFACGKISSTRQAEVAVHRKYRDVLPTVMPVPSTAEKLLRMRMEYEQKDVRVRE
jgi:hypothetical protein